MSDQATILARLTAVIEDRRKRRPADSYTTTLLRGGVEAVGAKVCEEAGELAEAARSAPPDREHVVHEAADLLYHTMVLLACCDTRLSDVEAELQRRFGTSGLDEKASRESSEL